MVYYDRYESALGTLYLTGTDDGLTGLSFNADLPAEAEPAVSGEFDLVKDWLDRFFDGDASAPQFPMKPAGTPFRQLVWDLLLEIPYGETTTYGELARKAARILGKERMSAQAVGQAVGHNPIAVVIPCHRVLGAGGKLTGYAYGLERKAWLLRHEQK